MTIRDAIVENLGLWHLLFAQKGKSQTGLLSFQFGAAREREKLA